MRFSAGNLEVVEEDLVRLVVHHVADAAQRHAPLFGAAQVHEKDGEPIGLLSHVGERRGAREQEHQVGVLHAGDPHLLPVHDVPVAAAFRERSHVRGVAAGRRLGDGERLQPQLARRDLRQVALLLLRRSVPQQRAHDVHLRVAGPGVRAGAVDLLENHRRLGDAQPPPPYSAGMSAASQPASVSALTNSVGYPSSSLIFCQYRPSNFEQSSRTGSRGLREVDLMGVFLV